MKKLLFLALLATALGNAQTVLDLSGMTSNRILGSSCGGELERFKTTGDLNLNGFTLTLQNATLEVIGNVNGSGSIFYCGNSVLCSRQSTQNNPQIQAGLSRNCQSLGIREFKKIRYEYRNYLLTVPDAKSIQIYDLKGRLVKSFLGTEINLEDLKTAVYLIKTDLGTIKLLR